MSKRYFTTLVALLLVTSAISPLVGLAGAQSSAPSGMVGVPDANVVAEDTPRSAPSAESFNVHTSKHAEDLEVTFTSVSDGKFALVLTDNQNHEGREVAIDAAALEQTYGDRPDTAWGRNDNGSNWQSPISYENGMAVLEVPHFSSNTVTFSGTISIQGSPAANGTQWTYNLSESEEVSNYSVTLTGHDSRDWENNSFSGVTDSETVSYSVDGTTSPATAEVTLTGTVNSSAGSEVESQTYPNAVKSVWEDSSGVYLAEGTNVHAVTSTLSEDWTYSHTNNINDVMEMGGTVFAAGDEEVSAVSASDGSENWKNSDGSLYHRLTAVESDGSTVWVAGYNQQVVALDAATGAVQYNVTQPANTVRDIDLGPNENYLYVASDDQTIYRIDLSTETVDWSYQDPEGDKVWGAGAGENYVYVGDRDGTVTALNPSDGSVAWTVGASTSIVRDITPAQGSAFVSTGGEIVALDADGGSQLWEREAFQNTVTEADYEVSSSSLWVGDETGKLSRVEHVNQTTDPSVSIGGTTVISHAGELEKGQTTTSTMSLSLTDNSGTVSVAGETNVDVAIEYKEVTESVDPAIVVNGVTYRYFGTLSNGSSTTLDVSAPSLQDGRNVVDVLVSEDQSGPTGEVVVNYSHEAIDARSVDYGSEAYSERYNVSKQFAADQSDATLTIPFRSNVIGLRTLETRTNGGSWSSVASSDYSLSGTDLTVQLGDVTTGDLVEVRAVGTKVQVNNGAIRVTDATALGESLSSKIRIDSYSSGFEIDVNETVYNEVHYTYSESWTNAQSYASVSADGSQSLYLPNAAAGESARIGTIPLEVDPADGHYDVRVSSAGDEPELDVRASTTASEVTLIWSDTTSGATYQLYSLTADTGVDRDTAESPVEFTHDGSDELLVIYDLGSGGSGAGAAGGGGGSVTSSPTDVIPLLLAAIAGLVVMFVVARRFGGGISSTTMFLVGSAIVGVLVVQALAPRILARSLGAALENSFALILLLVGGVLIVWLRSRQDNVSINLGRNR